MILLGVVSSAFHTFRNIVTTTFYKAVKAGRLKIKRNGAKIIVMRSAFNDFLHNLPDG